METKEKSGGNGRKKKQRKATRVRKMVFVLDKSTVPAEAPGTVPRSHRKVSIRRKRLVLADPTEEDWATSDEERPDRETFEQVELVDPTGDVPHHASVVDAPEIVTAQSFTEGSPAHPQPTSLSPRVNTAALDFAFPSASPLRSLLSFVVDQPAALD